ncbi:hypothetical protein GCM10010156_49630 [Planobispora rosea]|uniref:Uncharacterized protein n=1 Tax=Planobispora rosea TaxID=35762 RepID=A0A8J3S448_PLARO|nr:DUF6744 family protein [Planobispora rosea]GGS85097.1 hypothetical protein GCM10010156_49630 [Planobispora rosea]GIH86474.1 hypothetical protein Pro02_48820 [Planobispora rosea]
MSHSTLTAIPAQTTATRRGSAGAAAGLAAYTTAMERGDAPLFGYLVMYSIYGTETGVSHQELQRWFTELGLHQDFLPAPITPLNAYERVTGKTGVRTSYRLPESTPLSGEKVEATLMIRHVSREPHQITRHLVREVRDEGRLQLSYDPGLAEIIFQRADRRQPGAGSLQIVPNAAAIAALAPPEQDTVRATLAEVEDAYRRQCHFYSGDQLRTLIRTYIEALHAVRVRPSGGVYFVHRAHAAPLAGLRELVARFGAGSSLTRVPLPDDEEMREMVIDAFTTKAEEELTRLSLEIATARAEGASQAQVQALLRRFDAVKDSTTEHSARLATSLKSTEAALQLVHAQMASLLTSAC